MNISDDILEITDLGDPISLSDGPSSSHGIGMEFLMNDKMKSSMNTSAYKNDISLGDLDEMEKDLNDMSSSFNGSKRSSMDIFGNPTKEDYGGSSSHSFSVKFNDAAPSTSLGESTANLNSKNTWDGFGKLNSSMDPDTAPYGQKNASSSKEETLKRKLKRLHELEQLEKKGVNLTKKYTMESSLSEMDAEYNLHYEERTKKNSIKMMGQTVLTVVNALEWMNSKFDPFDLKLDGWGEQINDNMNDYEPIFEELHEKYKGSVNVAPELKLLFSIGANAAMLHMTNSMLSTSMPGMDDIMRENPELMRAFQTAAVNTMNKNKPNTGFGGFMNGLMGGGGAPAPPGVPVFQGGPPPPPMATQGPYAPPPPSRPGNNSGLGFGSRPDLQMSRGGDDLRDKYGAADSTEKTPRKIIRPEMRGPSDVGDILSGLKTKSVNIQSSTQEEFSSAMSDVDELNTSTISIADLKELQLSGGNLPKKSKRGKNRSEKNTISLDL